MNNIEYKEPKFNIIEFSSKDVIRTSNEWEAPEIEF